MFTSADLKKLADDHRPFFEHLVAIEANLKGRFVEADDAVDALVLAIATGESLLLLGPPGTGKSRMIRSFCHLLGLLDLDHPEQPYPDYYEALLSPFTEPSEIWGNLDIAKAMRRGVLGRQKGDWMQHARVVLLEEVFGASSAILKTLHGVLNERILIDRGQRVPMKLQCFFGSTNEVPETTELSPIFDRFLLRCRVEDVQLDRDSRDGDEPHERLGALIEKGWTETYGVHGDFGLYDGLLDRAAELHRAIRDIRALADAPIYLDLARMIRVARERQLSDMSNRRVVKLSHAMLVHCVYEYVKATTPLSTEETAPLPPDPQVGVSQLKLIPRFFLDVTDDETILEFDRIATEALHG